MITPLSAHEPELYVRPREVQLAVVRLEAGICRTCDKPLTEARFAWDHRITEPAFRPGPWRLGEDSFTLCRHTDGSRPCWTEVQDLPKAQCRACGAYESFHTLLEAYGDRVTCQACGDSHWYPIGD